MNPAKVIVVEDHEMVRELIISVVTDTLGHTVVAQGSLISQAVSDCLQHKPDLVILDLALPDGHGFEVVRRLGDELPLTRWLCLSALEQEHLVTDAVELGFHGFVSKRSSTTVFREAIVNVLNGTKFFCPSTSRLLAEAVRNQRLKPQTSLTSREQEVLAGVARGENTKEIASRLELEVKTVQNHLASVKEKLGIREPAGLVRWAMQRGLV